VSTRSWVTPSISCTHALAHTLPSCDLHDPAGPGQHVSEDTKAVPRPLRLYVRARVHGHPVEAVLQEHVEGRVDPRVPARSPKAALDTFLTQSGDQSRVKCRARCQDHGLGCADVRSWCQLEVEPWKLKGEGKVACGRRRIT
jgi:hypothetical protein